MTKAKAHRVRPKLVCVTLHVRTDLDLEHLRRKRSWRTALAASTGWGMDRDRIILESLTVKSVRFLDKE